ncbi:MAG: DUF4337 domain-containing protein [Alphaproteobacteria bacterium]|nr:DUF4337 domain-containing protein [Alphaproteobacteria bacterium]
METREVHEAIHEAGHGHHASQSRVNKLVAVLIAVLAALLAVTEMGGKSAQTTAVVANGDAANTWSFFQAKTIRQTMLRTSGELLEVLGPELTPAQAQRLEAWRKTVQRYETEPETGEGRKELAAHAKAAEARRERALAAYHQFEYASAALQLAIVLASAAVITSMVWLAWFAGGLGLVGAGLGALGFFAPGMIHF